MCDRDVWRNLRDRVPHPYSVADAEAYISHVASRPIQTNFGIDVTGEAIGSISLMIGEDITRKSAEIGYWIGSAAKHGHERQETSTEGREESHFGHLRAPQGVRWIH